LRLRGLDQFLVGLVLLLLLLGMLNLYSATQGEKEVYFYRQLIWNVMGLIFCFSLSFYDYHRLVKGSKFIYAFVLLLLLFTLVLERGAGGAKRWITLFGISFQPSEFMKPALILLYSRLLSVKGSIDGWKDVLELSLYSLIPALVIAKQPDLGTSAVILFIFFLYLFLSVSHLRHFFLSLLASLGSIPIFWEFLKDYQKRRLLVFLDPEYDPLGAGYNLLQAKISLGAGGIFGAGFLRGLQHRLRFLPEHHTDFVFCVWGEEFGFLGTSLLLLLYSLLLWRMYHIALLSKDKEGFYLVSGVLSIFFLHIFVNVAMTLGLIPVKGLPLPFFSYGGSVSLSFMASLGMVLSVYRHRFLRES